MKYIGYLPRGYVRDFYAGRIWDEARLPPNITAREVMLLQRYGYVKSEVAIQKEGCLRCGTPHGRHIIQHNVTYCRHCIAMGRMTNRTNLLTWQGRSPIFLKWPYVATTLLSEAQQRVSDELIASLQMRRGHLVDAVCGAGKTEMLFAAIGYALAQGQRVCVATPRADVVRELAPRFARVFPQVVQHALYGGAPEQAGIAQLVIATTHQLYHFRYAFDVMIVDEADAFPYTYDSTLQHAVNKAKKQKAPIIIVTATPSKVLLQRVQKENMGHSKVWRRYHGYDLPVPRFVATFHYERTLKKRLPRSIVSWLQTCLNEEKPFLLFFATKQLMEAALPFVQQMNLTVTSVHASDEQRIEKVQQLRDKKCAGLLTTTILERGITISNVQVGVVGAEHTIFEASALIQISGRAGRHANYATGDVVFFHNGITQAMSKARHTIRQQNEVNE